MNLKPITLSDMRQQMAGYRGLYGGLGMHDIHQRKRLKAKDHVLDQMGAVGHCTCGCKRDGSETHVA